MPGIRALLVALTLSLPLQSAWAGSDPKLIWQTIETPHFRIHFYQGEYLIAMKVARAAEEAYAKVVPLLEYEPTEPCHIVITDDTDGANGSARVVPYNLIRIFATAPAEDSILSDYDDWLRALILHEYTHIVHLDTIGGIPKVVDKVIGKVWAPNQIEPRWIIEGLATFAESYLTTAGRATSTATDMHLRMAILEGRMLTLDQISSSPESWPRGNAFYLFGSTFLTYIAERFGAKKLTEFSHQYGKGLIPYGLNKTARQVFGKDFVELYDDWLLELEARYAKQKAEIEAAGRVEGVRLTTTGEQQNAPRFSPDGEYLIYYGASGSARPGIKISEFGPKSALRDGVAFGPGLLEGFSSSLLLPTSGRSTAAFLPDGSGLILHQRDVTTMVYSYNDLYHYDFASKKLRRLTVGERASDPDVSPDGRFVVYAQNRAGSANLAILDLQNPDAAPRVIVENVDFSQVFTPHYSPDGKTVAISLWRRGGFRDIALVDVETGDIKNITHDRALDTEPVFSSDGNVLYFSSDRSGIANIYAYDLSEERLYQVTNVLGGAFEPNPSPDGSTLVYIGYNSFGFDLYALPIDRETWREAPPSPIRDEPAYADEPLVTEEEAALPVKPYSPFSTLRPYTWMPVLGRDPYGSTVGLVTQGADAVGNHSFSLAAQLGTTNGNPTLSATYRYNGTFPNLTAGVSRTTSTRRLSFDTQSIPYVEESYAFSASATIPFRRLYWFSSLSLRYDGQWVQPDDGNLIDKLPYNPGGALPTYPDRGFISGLSASITFSSSRRFVFSVSPEEGFDLSFTVRVRDRLLGSDFESLEFFWSADKYIPLRFLGEYHVLSLALSGGAGGGDARVRRFFVLGGLPSQDVFGALTLLTPSFVGGGFLRGFPNAFTFGNQFHLLSAEYRFPIVRLERGVASLPLYGKKLHGRLFTDYGAAFLGPPSPETFLPFGLSEEGVMRSSVGAELLFDGVVGYYLGTTVRLGVARGLGEGGITDFYFLVGAPF